MTYTTTQIENAKVNYTTFLKVETIADYDVATIGMNTAEQRSEFHNKIVNGILAGNKELEKEWKTFFLNEQVKSDRKATESKAKLDANKSASADILAPIKAAKKLGEYYIFVKSTKRFASEFFSKRFSHASVNAFLSL